MDQENDQYGNQYETMMHDFDRYKKNRQNVPLETLKTKYQKPYEALKQKLKKELQWYAKEIAFIGLGRIKSEDYTEESKERWITQLRKIFEEECATELPKLLGAAIYKHLDMHEFENLVCGTLTNRIRYEVYAPYWLTHCREEGGTIRNDLIDMTWDPEHNIWTGTTADGNFCWTSMLPPTQNLIDKERDKDREEFEKWMKELEAKEKKEETA